MVPVRIARQASAAEYGRAMLGGFAADGAGDTAALRESMHALALTVEVRAPAPPSHVAAAPAGRGHVINAAQVGAAAPGSWGGGA